MGGVVITIFMNKKWCVAITIYNNKIIGSVITIYKSIKCPSRDHYLGS